MIQEQLQKEGSFVYSNSMSSLVESCVFCIEYKNQNYFFSLLNSASFEQINIRDGADVFWKPLGKALQCDSDATEFLGPLEHPKIKTVDDFLDINTFHQTEWKFSNAVLILDEFNTLYNTIK